MRILMANTYHYLRGGDSAYALGISSALREAGHEVFPFAMKGETNLPTEYSEYFTPELDYPALQARGGLANAWRVVSNSVYNRDARRSFARLLDENPVDLVHLHSIMHHLTASIVLECRRRGIPIVWTLHDAKACCPTTRFMREGRVCHDCAHGRFYRAVTTRCKRGSLAASAIVAFELYLHRLWRIYEGADLLLAPSRFLEDLLVGTGLRPRRIEVLPNYVDVSDFDPSPGDSKYVLYVGRLSPEKGLDVLLEATSRERRIPLRIAGSGEMERKLREQCRARGLEHVHFEGQVDRARMMALLRGARALILPSICDENCPLSILESFAAGRAVLATRSGGVPELVREGETGQLVEKGSAGALAEALGRVVDAPDEWERMGRRARMEAKRRYDRSGHLNALVAHYQEVLSHRNRP
jgi:glycosyltransferase involved in cell wall biosynthesis